MSNSILALLSMKTRKVWLYTGKDTESEITNTNLEDIIDNLKENVKTLEYYEIWMKLLEDFDYYYNKVNIFRIVVFSIFGLAFLIFVILFIIVVVFRCPCAKYECCSCCVDCVNSGGSYSSSSSDSGFGSSDFDGGGGGGAGGSF